MSEVVKLAVTIDTTDPACALGMEIWLDGQQIFNDNHVASQIIFEHEFADTDGQHELKFVMKGKSAEHTQIDSTGQIIKDARLTIKDFKFDEIELGHMLTQVTSYSHDFNGTEQPIQEKFYGELGCNGVVNLAFTTPVYLWLLENM